MIVHQSHPVRVTSQKPIAPGDTPIDERRLEGLVRALAVPRHAIADARNNAWVAHSMTQWFKCLGLQVHSHGRHRNIVALPRGGSTRPLTLVAAHYDTVPGCPGADDNASALAAMLECARWLAPRAAREAVGFVAFNAEEDGLLGSREFVETGLAALGRPVAGVHVLEMVGYRPRQRDAPAQSLPIPWIPPSLRVPDYLGLLTNGRGNTLARRVARAHASPSLRVVTARSWGPIWRLLPDLGRSDHLPFWRADIPAALWTDTGNFRNPHYHRAGDTPDTLDYAFMRQVTELLCATLDDAR